MPNVFDQRPPTWFRIVAVVLLLWGAGGCYACFQQFRLGADAMPGATAYDRALYAALPGWYDWVYALAVASGLLGAVALLARSALARPLFAISLVSVLIQFGFLFAMSDLLRHKGAAATLPFPVLIVAVAAGEVWLGGYALRRGWIR